MEPALKTSRRPPLPPRPPAPPTTDGEPNPLDSRLWAILGLLHQHADDGAAADEIGQTFGITATRVMELLPRLVQLGLVQEAPLPDRFRLTTAGKELADRRA
jgi:hypothetical protein